jgi:hypothetical protein
MVRYMTPAASWHFPAGLLGLLVDVTCKQSGLGCFGSWDQGTMRVNSTLRSGKGCWQAPLRCGVPTSRCANGLAQQLVVHDGVPDGWLCFVPGTSNTFKVATWQQLIVAFTTAIRPSTYTAATSVW